MIVVRMIAIQTLMILYPPVTSHSRPLIARLGLSLCFQPDGGVLGVSESDEEGRKPIPSYASTSPSVVTELQRNSLHRWFEMRATGTYSHSP